MSSRNLLTAVALAWTLLLAVPIRAEDMTHFFDEHPFRDAPGDCRLSTSRNTPLAEAQFSLPWLRLELDTEEAVLSRFGATPSIPGGEYRFYFCYQDLATGAVAVLAGVRPDVFQVTLADSAQRLRSGVSCRRTPLASFTTATAGGLRLGLTRAEAKALLGEPLRESPTRLYYGEVVRLPSSPPEQISRVRTITVRLDKGTVYSFTLRQVTAD